MRLPGSAGLCLLAGAVVAGCQGGARSLVVRGATVIDGTGAPPIQDAVLVVAGDRIRCVGHAADCPAPTGARDVDATGFWLVPGFIDTHIRARFGTERTTTERDQRLRFLLGITLARDVSRPEDLDANVAAARTSADPKRPLPRLVVAGRADAAVIVDSASAWAEIARLAAAGVGSVNLRGALADDLLRTIGAAARSRGLPIWGDAWSDDPPGSAVSDALDAGFAGLSGMVELPGLAAPEAALRSAPTAGMTEEWQSWRRSLWLEADQAVLDSVGVSLAERGVWIEPFLAAEWQWGERYQLPLVLHPLYTLPFVVEREPVPPIPLSEASRERIRRSLERAGVFFRGFRQAGGAVITGSEDVTIPGLGIHEEMRLLTENGFSPADALAAATSDAARALGVADSLGTIQEGKLADFVMLQGNPLEDITNTQLVSRVVKGGVSFDPANLLDGLRKDLTDRTTPPGRRLIVTLVALLATIVATVIAIRRHARRLPPRPPPLRAI